MGLQRQNGHHEGSVRHSSKAGSRSAGVRDDRWYRVGVMTTNNRVTASRHAMEFNLPVDVLGTSLTDPPVERWRHADGGWQREMFTC